MPNSNPLDNVVFGVCDLHVNETLHNMYRLKELKGTLNRDTMARDCRRSVYPGLRLGEGWRRLY
jgi:hypothetical protein